MDERQRQDWDRGSWEIEIFDAAGTVQVRGEQYRIAGFVPNPEGSPGVRLLLQFAVHETTSGLGSPRNVVLHLDEKVTRRLQVGIAKLLADLDMRRLLDRKGRGSTEQNTRMQTRTD